MIIGIPKEIKTNENRVAVTPAGASEFVKNGHEVFVQSSAGEGSGFSDAEYEQAGAQLLPDIEAVYAKAEMIIKVKEPIEQEYKLARPDQLIFTYFHFASSRALTEAMLDSGSVCIAYETVEGPQGKLPLLVPMSEVAGRMAVQEGAKYLEKIYGGSGVMLGGVPGVRPGKVLILGAGVVGSNAAKMAVGLGAQVTIMDINLDRLRYLNEVFPDNLVTQFSNKYNIEEQVAESNLIIGSVLIPGGKAPQLITRDMLKIMKPGTVLIDVAVDQGGCIETCEPTTHEDPIYKIEDIVHYCVANMPGAVPRTSTLALTNATLPYALQLANKGWVKACRDNSFLAKGLNIVNGEITYENVATAFGLEYIPMEKYLQN